MRGTSSSSGRSAASTCAPVPARQDGLHGVHTLSSATIELCITDDRVNVVAVQLLPAAEERELDQEREADDLAAEPLDEPDRPPPRCRRSRARRRRSAPARPGAIASRWISRRSVPYSSSYSSRSISHGSLPGLAHRHEPGARAGTRPAPRTRSPRASMPTHLVDRLVPRTAPRARRPRRRTRRRAASSGVMSLKTMPGFGWSGMSRTCSFRSATPSASRCVLARAMRPLPARSLAAARRYLRLRPTLLPRGRGLRPCAPSWCGRPPAGRGHPRRRPRRAGPPSSVVLDDRHARRRPTRRRASCAAGGRASTRYCGSRVLPAREQRRGDEDRRVRTDGETDRERERELLERGRAHDQRADDQQRQHRQQRDDRRRQRTHQHRVQRLVHHLADRSTRPVAVSVRWFSRILSNTTTVS